MFWSYFSGEIYFIGMTLGQFILKSCEIMFITKTKTLSRLVFEKKTCPKFYYCFLIFIKYRGLKHMLMRGPHSKKNLKKLMRDTKC